MINFDKNIFMFQTIWPIENHNQSTQMDLPASFEEMKIRITLRITPFFENPKLPFVTVKTIIELVDM